MGKRQAKVPRQKRSRLDREKVNNNGSPHLEFLLWDGIPH